MAHRIPLSLANRGVALPGYYMDVIDGNGVGEDADDVVYPGGVFVGVAAY